MHCFTGAYVIAWLAGLVTPGAPAGVGVRELVMYALLPYLDQPIGLAHRHCAGANRHGCRRPSFLSTRLSFSQAIKF